MMLTARIERQASARKRRVARAAAAVAIVAAASALGAGVALAFFSDSSSSLANLALGTVALTLNTPQTNTCAYNALTPGDLTGTPTCALSVTYTGSIQAYVSLTVAIQSKAGAGGHTLYDPIGGNGLTLRISDGQTTFTVPAGAGTACGSSMCWTASNDLAAWYSGSTSNLIFNTNDAVTWTVTPLFPNTVTNAYQGASATVTLTAQAVQSPGNSLSCTPTPTIGQPCTPSGTFAWS